MSMFFRNVAVLAAVGIVGVVLFQAVCGPFTATYGPASAFRAMANAALLIFALCTLMVSHTETSKIRLRPAASPAALAERSALPTLALRC